jgi:hypothetical protein
MAQWPILHMSRFRLIGSRAAYEPHSRDLFISVLSRLEKVGERAVGSPGTDNPS